MALEPLRYPAAIIDSDTDYLQIVIRESITTGIGTNNNRPTGNLFGNNNATISTSLIKGIIVLPMPSNIQDGNSVGYADDSLNGFAAGALGSVTNIFDSSIFDQAGRENIKTELNNLLNQALSPEMRSLINRTLAAEAVNIFGTNITPQQILARETGQIFNPNMELLFNNVTLRNFKFSFKITPRSKDEADGVKSIIRTLKTYMAPSFESSYFLKTPKTFELYFKTGNSDHKFLNRFKPCFLTDMEVNYTAENVYSTLPGGEPVSMIMDLSFKEIEPVYQGDYDTDEGKLGVGY
jgi:hypothetical protein